MQHREVPLQVDRYHRVPLRFLHAGDKRIAQDSRVIDQDVEATELVDRLSHNTFRTTPGGDVLGVDDGGAAGGGDLSGHLVGWPGVGALAFVAAAEVVDDDLGPFFGEQQCVFATDAAARAGDDRHSAFQCSH